MPPQYTTGQQVLEVIIRSPEALVDDVVFQCPDLTWNQIFLAIDRLSREGALTLAPKRGGLYEVQVSDRTALTIQPMGLRRERRG
jgi:hypothetical protein